MNLKVLSTLDSRNFFVSLVSIFLLSFELNGLSTGADPGQVVDAISAKDIGLIASLVLLNFLNPVLKLIQKTASWSWAFLKSPNFWTQVGTTVIAGLAMLGIQFPDGAASEVVSSIFSGDVQAIMIALVINVINPLYHFFFDKPKLEEGAKEPDLVTLN